jgi:copper chaperone CopZ
LEYYIHSVPGRLRIKSPALKRNQAGTKQVEVLLRGFAGVTRTSTNPLTGSIVVNYDQSSINQKEVIDLLEKAGHFRPEKALTNDEYIHDAASRAGKLVWDAVFGSFVGAALEGTPLAMLSVLV